MPGAGFAAIDLDQGVALTVAVTVLALLSFYLFFLNKPVSLRRKTQSGNVFFTLFGAVALVGVVGAAGMSVIKGPVRSMHTVTQRTIAENNMIASAKLSIISAAQQGDCDDDGTIEPISWTLVGSGPKPTGGGYLPASIGASLMDPWNNSYGYCVWDHGSQIKKTTPAPTCPTPADRLSGAALANGPVLAVLSAGPDRVYQTTCGNAPTYVNKPSGSDDIVLIHTYAEASALAAGLWNLKSTDPDVAEIKKDLEVKNASNAVVFGVDSTTDTSKPSIKVDYIKALANTAVEYLSNIKLGSMWLSGDGGNEGIRIDAAGKVGIGTATPSTELHVNGGTGWGQITVTGELGPGVRLKDTNAAANAKEILMRSENGNTLLMSLTDGGGVQKTVMTVNNLNGNTVLGDNNELVVDSVNNRVGIGTVSPVAPFQVRTTTNQNIFVASNTNGADSGAVGFASVNDANNAYAPLGFIGSRFSFNTGNVGVGTTTPGEKLHVVGSVKISGTGNYLYVTGGTPTIILQETNARGATLASAGADLDFRNNSGPNSTTTSKIGSHWPLSISMDDDKISMGGQVYMREGALDMTSYPIRADVGALRDADGGWVRTYGNTGWYSQTYGGGWYMIDTSWIRAYNDKNVYTGGQMRASSVAAGSYCDANGANCKTHASLGGGGITSEDDPQVGALTANLWCRSNSGGTAIICDRDVPKRVTATATGQCTPSSSNACTATAVATCPAGSVIMGCGARTKTGGGAWDAPDVAECNVDVPNERASANVFAGSGSGSTVYIEVRAICLN